MPRTSTVCKLGTSLYFKWHFDARVSYIRSKIRYLCTKLSVVV